MSKAITTLQNQQNEKNKEMEIRKRFDYSRNNSLSHWVTPKDLQIYRYRNYLVPTLPRTRPINEASSMR
jgi:hypothetical protein